MHTKSLLVALCALIALGDASKTRLTPFGETLDECVVTVPHGSKVIETETGIDVHTAEGALLRSIRSNPNCQMPDKSARSASVGASIPDGWLDNAGYYLTTDELPMTKFTSLYTVPEDPKSQSADPVLFYFIGSQNNNGGKNKTLSILQPVLTWGNGLTGWSMASWYCCPKNFTVSSQPFQGFKAGDTLYGSIEETSDKPGNEEYLVVSAFTDAANATISTTLQCDAEQRWFNWLDTTLEVYNIKECDDLARGKMTFSDMHSYGANGKELSPLWKMTPATDCGGTIATNGPNSIVIEHNAL